MPEVMTNKQASLVPHAANNSSKKQRPSNPTNQPTNPTNRAGPVTEQGLSQSRACHRAGPVTEQGLSQSRACRMPRLWLATARQPLQETTPSPEKHQQKELRVIRFLLVLCCFCWSCCWLHLACKLIMEALPVLRTPDCMKKALCLPVPASVHTSPSTMHPSAHCVVVTNNSHAFVCACVPVNSQQGGTVMSEVMNLSLVCLCSSEQQAGVLTRGLVLFWH